MLNIPNRAKQELIKAYRAFYEKAVKEESKCLTLEERKAIGQKVFNDIIDKAISNLDIPESQHQILRQELEKLIREECSDLLSGTLIEYTEKGFRRKET